MFKPERSNPRLSNILREVLASWIVLLFVLGLGLVLLTRHDAGGNRPGFEELLQRRDEASAAADQRDEDACAEHIRTCSELRGADPSLDPETGAAPHRYTLR